MLKIQKGITLVAIVVTIIVLIILAGISVNLLLGDNGILQKAKDASVAQEKAEIKEKIGLDITAKQIQGQGIVTKADVEAVLGAYGEVQYNQDETIKSVITEKGYEIALSEIYTGEIKTITITYNKNDANATGTMASSGATVLASTYTAPTGKKFKEWNSKADGTGTKYEVGQTVTEDSTLYAIWKDSGIKFAGATGTVAVSNTKESLKGHYGDSVDSSFFTSNEETDWTWQLFYDDDTYIYLIASDYVKNSKLPMNGNEGYGTTDLIKTTQTDAKKDYCARFTSSARYNDGVLTAGTIYKEGSASTAITGNRLTSTYLKWVANNRTSTNTNIQAVAYMMDTAKWSNFAGSMYSSAQAIGGPTVELFVKSYNAVNTSNPLGTYDTMTLDTNYNTKGYKVWRNSDDTWQGYGDSNDLGSESNMWCNHSNTNANGYWLASPSSSDVNFVRGVSYNGYLYYYSAYNASYGFRPVVSILKSEI